MVNRIGLPIGRGDATLVRGLMLALCMIAVVAVLSTPLQAAENLLRASRAEPELMGDLGDLAGTQIPTHTVLPRRVLPLHMASVVLEAVSIERPAQAHGGRAPPPRPVRPAA